MAKQSGGIGKAVGRNFMKALVWLYRRSGGKIGGSMRRGTQSISHSSPAVQNGHTGRCIRGGATFNSAATICTSCSSVVIWRASSPRPPPWYAYVASVNRSQITHAPRSSAGTMRLLK